MPTSDKQLIQGDVLEGRDLDRGETQLGMLEQAKGEFNKARAKTMKLPGYHPAYFNRRQRRITG